MQKIVNPEIQNRLQDKKRLGTSPLPQWKAQLIILASHGQRETQNTNVSATSTLSLQVTPLGSLSCVREGTGLGATCVLGGTAAAYGGCQDGSERLDQLTAPTYHLRSQWAPIDYLLVFYKAANLCF